MVGRWSAGCRVAPALVVVAALLAGCQSGAGPEAAAKEWLTSVVEQDGNATAHLTCRSAEKAAQEGTLWITVASLIGGDIIGQAVDMDITDVRFTTTSQSGSSATVHAQGPFRVAILGFWQSQDIDEDLPMTQEDGIWKVCGS